MSSKYVQKGTVLPFTAPGAGVVAGTPIRIGSVVLVPLVTVTAAEVTADPTIKFSGRVTGVVEVPRATGGGTAWVQGGKIYWDDSAKKFTKSVVTDSGDTLVGFAIDIAGDSAATGFVRLDGVVR